MLDWLNTILANMAYDAALNSVNVASHNGMYQIEEPASLKNEISK